ncbi:RecQ family ATP-dependent DNA helicase [Viscerimonas tarda]
MSTYHEILYKYWGYSSFRPLQEDIIRSVAAGKDTLGLMPTGGGKSLTFQAPTMAMEGLCLVVTPLIALMKDQVDNLKQRGIKALAVYTGMTYQEILVTLENAVLGDYKFLYVSPERLASELFLKKLKDMNICLLVVDEAHCISQWGYDFRPSYLNIVNIREYLPKTPVLALTATATPGVVDDIQNNLGFGEKNVFRKSYKRDNLAYSVYETENKMGSLIRILNKIAGCTIVYVRSRQKTKEIAEELVNCGFSADYYHAGLRNEEKTRKQNAWKNNERRIIVSTNAFGMGIDKPDVRLVIHTDLPNSIEEYFQEAGRGGRDEKKSYAVILYTKNDKTVLKKRISDGFPERTFVVHVYEALAYFLQVAEGFGTNKVYDFNLYQFCSTYKLPINQTHNALKILDMAGYIEYTDEEENRSRLIFRVYRDELYHYDLGKEYDQVINIILRLYPGIFTDYINIDETAIATRLNRTRNDVYEMLKVLTKQNIIDYIPHKKTPLIVYTQPRQDARYVRIPKNVYEERKDRFKDRIEAMANYAERKDVCRSRMLLAYFGETDSKDCGQCDVCLSKSKRRLSSANFDMIFEEVKNILNKQTLTIEALTEQLPAFPAEDIIEVIRFQIDRGVIVLDIGKLRLG